MSAQAFWNKDRIGGLIILFASLVYASQISLIPEIDTLNTVFTGRSMPMFLAAGGLFLGSILLCRRSTETNASGWEKLDWLRFLSLAVLMVLYGVALPLSGFLPATIIFLIATMFTLGERRPTLLLSVPAILAIGFWLLISQAMGIYLPAFNS